MIWFSPLKNEVTSEVSSRISRRIRVLVLGVPNWLTWQVGRGEFRPAVSYWNLTLAVPDGGELRTGEAMPPLALLVEFSVAAAPIVRETQDVEALLPEDSPAADVREGASSSRIMSVIREGGRALELEETLS